jgi:outer membrane protein OmpA-like peptidoglycan-associated protein
LLHHEGMTRSRLATWALPALLVAASASAEPNKLSQHARVGELCEIAFDAGSTTPALNSERKLDEAATWAAQNPYGLLVLDGHAEAAESPSERSADVALSLHRAEAVRDALTRAGIDADQIVIAAYGSDAPPRTNPAEDRRVTVWATHDDLDAVIARLGNADVVIAAGTELPPHVAGR